MTIALIIGLLLLIFRSPVAALVPVLTVGLVLAISSAIIAAVYQAIEVQTDQDLPVLLTVVLYGIGTDYTLFLLFRYRERLREATGHARRWRARWGRVGSAFLAMLLATLEFLTTLGPAMAVAIGTDYNILMVARLREEARAGATPREAALVGRAAWWPGNRSG